MFNTIQNVVTIADSKSLLSAAYLTSSGRIVTMSKNPVRVVTPKLLDQNVQVVEDEEKTLNFQTLVDSFKGKSKKEKAAIFDKCSFLINLFTGQYFGHNFTSKKALEMSLSDDFQRPIDTQFIFLIMLEVLIILNSVVNGHNLPVKRTDNAKCNMCGKNIYVFPADDCCEECQDEYLKMEKSDALIMKLMNNSAFEIYVNSALFNNKEKMEKIYFDVINECVEFMLPKYSKI